MTEENKKPSTKLQTDEVALEKSKIRDKKSFANKRKKDNERLIAKHGFVPERKAYTRTVPLISDEQRLATIERNRESARKRYTRLRDEKIAAKQPPEVASVVN